MRTDPPNMTGFRAPIRSETAPAIGENTNKPKLFSAAIAPALVGAYPKSRRKYVGSQPDNEYVANNPRKVRQKQQESWEPKNISLPAKALALRSGTLQS